jgi:hypothetical protein
MVLTLRDMFLWIMECDLMIAGIFDRLFKKKKEPESAEYADVSALEYTEDLDGMDQGRDLGYEGPRFYNVPAELEMDSSINYKFEGPEYRLKLHNKSIDMIGDITVNLRSEKKNVVSIIDTKKVLEMLEPGKSAVMKFKLKPNYRIGKTGIYGKIDYFDFKSKERKMLRLPQAFLDFELKEFTPKRIDEDKWRQICSPLKNFELETKRLDLPPDKVFTIFKNALTNLDLFMLPPIENPNLYRGIARFYGYDDEESNYAVEIQVIGDKQSSKVLFRIWCDDAQGAMALAFKTIDIVDGLIKIKEFIVET